MQSSDSQKYVLLKSKFVQFKEITCTCIIIQVEFVFCFFFFKLTIPEGDENNDFFIGRDNGNILLAKNLDWEKKREYNITVGITDGVHAITTQLYITVIDQNDQVIFVIIVY